MDFLFESPLNRLIAGGLLGTAGLAAILSVRRFLFSYRKAGELSSAQWFVRAIRCLIIALTAGVWAAGFFWNQSWLLIIGLVIICQELYETAILGIILRSGKRNEDNSTPLRSSTCKVSGEGIETCS